MAIVVGVEVSAHRRDEYLQAARIAIDPGRVHIEVDLTPGIALAEEIIAGIDRNHDRTMSSDEQRAYGRDVLSALVLEVDRKSVRLEPAASSYPDAGAMRRGEGTIRIETTGTLPRLTVGAHQLRFRNGHRPQRSVYLANALVPGSDDIAITEQRRDVGQRELTIDFVVRAAPAPFTPAWLLSGGLAAMASGLLLTWVTSLATRSGARHQPTPPAGGALGLPTRLFLNVDRRLSPFRGPDQGA